MPDLFVNALSVNAAQQSIYKLFPKHIKEDAVGNKNLLAKTFHTIGRYLSLKVTEARCDGLTSWMVNKISENWSQDWGVWGKISYSDSNSDVSKLPTPAH